MVDERRCAAGARRCRGFVVLEGKRLAAQIETATGLCPPCQAATKSAMRRAPADWCKLKLTLGEHRAPVGGKVYRPKPGSTVPLNVATDELMRWIVEACSAAASIVATATNSPWNRPARATSSRRDYQLIEKASRLVCERVDKLVDTADGVEWALRITELHRMVVAQLGETAQRERKHLPCPQCGRAALVKEVQDLRGREYSDGVETPEVIRCLACDGNWSEAEYEWLSTMVLTEREEMNMLKWLLAEARWERDVAAWLAAEREWALGNIANDLGIELASDLVDRVRTLAAVPA